MSRSRRPARELRRAIDAMPLDTRKAMLAGIEANPIIVGAYVAFDDDDGICPMLAAHRHGGRTRYAEFAPAWDRYAGAGKRPRPATPREMAALRSMLETSIAAGELSFRGSLRKAIVEHRRVQFARARREEHDVEPSGLELEAPLPAVRATAPPSAGRTESPARCTLAMS